MMMQCILMCNVPRKDAAGNVHFEEIKFVFQTAGEAMLLRDTLPAGVEVTSMRAAWVASPNEALEIIKNLMNTPTTPESSDN